jgi:hypothetical protein
MDLLVAVEAEARAKLDGVTDPIEIYAIGDAAKAAYASQHERQHDADGRPRGDHPSPLSKAQEADLVAAITQVGDELVAARERDREAREAALSSVAVHQANAVEEVGPVAAPDPVRVEPSFAIRPRTRPRPHPNQPRTIYTQLGDDDD